MRVCLQYKLLGFLFGVMLFSMSPDSRGCSTYKVTVGGKTMHGVNYDAWFTKPRIWFEKDGYGAAFTGGNNMGADGFSPQSGMNVHGLSFATLATATPRTGSPATKSKQITSRARYLKDILHHCRTVEEVKAWVEQFDHSFLIQDVFLYTDKSGKYLVVEPFTSALGNEDRYVLANFCPSTVTDFGTIKQQRYVNGSTFLKNKIDASLAFCTALSDTMHVCRKKIGDGTLLTSIWDSDKGNVHLYFYHDYKNQVQFNLDEELAKGDHSIEIPSLFPKNAEFEQLVAFKTPMNSAMVDWLLRAFVVLFLVSACYFLLSYFLKRKEKYSGYKLAVAALSVVLLGYVVVLATQMNVYYFPAPYTDPASAMLSMASYIPFLVLMGLIPLVWVNWKVFAENAWQSISKWLFALHNLSCLILIALFSYWGLYNVFS